MKICYFGIYNPNYSRNDILLSGLNQIGVEVIQCRADWQDPKRYFKLWKNLRALHNEYNCVYVAYPSPIATILARLISSKPIICDAFYSMFDCVVNDRQEIPWWHPKAIKLLIIDWFSIMFATAVITDTKAHKQYWASWRGLNGKKIHPVYLGVNNKTIYPLNVAKKDYFLVHWHGSYIPAQGVEKIIEAVKICASDPKIRFRMIGDGAGFKKIQKLVENYNLSNLEVVGHRVPLSRLNEYMAESDATLGLFGDVERASRAVPNKVYEGLAAGKAVISMESPAVREIFSDEEILFVHNDPESIADGIKMLANNPEKCKILAKNGYAAVSKYFPAPIARLLINIISKYV